ncbi:MAG: AI-2E family transporter [Thermoanaerobaculia bacterium]
MTSSPNPLQPVAPIAVSPDAAPHVRRSRPSNEEIAAWVLLGALLLFIILHHLVGATITGLTLYLILDKVSARIARRLSGSAARPLALVIVALITAAVLTGAIALFIAVVRRGAANVSDMMNQMAEILGSVRLWLGGLGHQFIPEFMTDAENLKTTVATWLKTHAQNLRAGGLWIGVGLVHVVMGVLLSVLVFFRHVTNPENDSRGPLAVQLSDKVDRFADAFRRIASAQIKISAVNTTLTAIYLLVILPLFGIQIPFARTLIPVTFVCGLIPVLGNLVSNTVITILSLGVSGGVAIASLAFLVVIHKLEYLINSRIVGGETDSEAWEILLAIVIGEAAFGIGGVVLAPIVYAFIKRELRDHALV